jgi:hypothetical protein
MKTPLKPRDELFEVELRIARRADELVRRFGFDPAHALERWRQAEREIWKDFRQWSSPIWRH